MEISTQKLLLEVNRKYPAGTIPIQYKKKDGSVHSAIVRFPAEVIESGKIVIWLKGELDAIDIKDIIL